MSVAVIIPFRDRGADPLRAENLERVRHHWSLFDGEVFVVDDGRTGKAQFNRSAAYNRGAKLTDANILVYAEADMLIHYEQIEDAVLLAEKSQGMVVPFTRRLELSATDSIDVRKLKRAPKNVPGVPAVDANYGCINVLSRATLNAVGQWDETFQGWGHDDAAMWIAFNIAAGPTRLVDGDAYHLYHAPPMNSEPADRAAQMENARRMELYCQAHTAEQIRHLTAGGKGLSKNWRGQLV